MASKVAPLDLLPPHWYFRVFPCLGSTATLKALKPKLKKKSHNKWEAYFDNGREPSGLDVIEWAKKVESLGAGEIMLTSIDAEGTKKGFDIDLNKRGISVYVAD